MLKLVLIIRLFMVALGKEEFVLQMINAMLIINHSL